MTTTINNLLSTPEAARRLGVSTSWLNHDRVSHGRIPFVRVGRAVRYRPEDIDAFVERSKRRSTSDHGTYNLPRQSA